MATGKRRVTQEGPVAKRARNGRPAEQEKPAEPPENRPGRVNGEPPVWAEYRTELCDALPWFRAVQGGAYSDRGLCFGCLLDADSGLRPYVDDEIIITRIGGNCEKDQNGNLVLLKDHDESSRALKPILESQRADLAVGLIIGDRNTAIGRHLPHRYNVMAYFRITHVWFEKVGARNGARVRFQKLDLEEKSWWAAEGSCDPLPISERRFSQPDSQLCRQCSSPSDRVYSEGWMCLHPQCSDFWKIDGASPPDDLTYHPRFLSAREPPDEKIQPQYSLVPDLLSTLEETPDVALSRIAWKGIICPLCRKCIARKHWEGWICTDPLSNNGAGSHVNSCPFRKIITTPVTSLRSVVLDFEVGVIQRAFRPDPKGIMPKREVTKAYQKFTYTIENIGTVTHFSANRSVLNQPNGPNDLFKQLQRVNIGLRRYPLQQCVVAGTLTSHYAVNFGMPYKYVVSVDSKGFDQAPPDVMRALGRLTWATEQAVTAAGDDFLPPNELLTLAYFEDMSIGYHDDGESSLGPTIATLSLGAKATMKIRLKDQYVRGCSAARKLLTEDVVLPGCEMFDERKALKAGFDNQQMTRADYDKARLEIVKRIKRREGDNIITMEIHHGDLVVMHGAEMQRYYEHSVKPENKLRFALTSRYVKPEHVEAKDLPKGNFTLTPDEVYNGE